MGTRNLTIVYLDDEYKVAQYGQWDGYPGGVGLDCLNFLHKLKSENLIDKFVDAVRKCRYFTDDELKVFDTFDYEPTQDEIHALSRDTGADILDYILESNGLKLKNRINFAAKSLFCEWAYVIDLDHMTFEVYKGFNKTPLTPEDRFYFLVEHEDKGDDKYYTVIKVAEFDINNLPEETEFLNTADPPEEEDDEVIDNTQYTYICPNCGAVVKSTSKTDIYCGKCNVLLTLN